MRMETDGLGRLPVPEDAYWGIHTQRALANFPVSGKTSPLGLIRAYAQVKKACCQANRELGFLDVFRAEAIARACDHVLAGDLDDQFPVDALQGGAGTSTNMNLNEVIANRALELLGRPKGDYRFLHPIEHVNLHQSTNDTYPTALKVAAINALRRLNPVVAALQGVLQRKEKEFAHIVIMGRTEWQDAVPITLGAQFASFAEAIARDRWRCFKCEERLRVVNLGGTAVGTGITAPRRYIFLATEKLRELTGLGLSRAENLMDQTANCDPLVEVSGILKAHAANLRKISADLRLLHFSGEIALPPVQAGSSIMPGKVNPVILESVIGTAIRIQANDAVVTEAASLGTLQINEFLPLLASALLESMEWLQAVDGMLGRHLDQVTASETVCAQGVDRSPTLITALVPFFGYETAEGWVKEFRESGATDFRKFLGDKVGLKLLDKALAPAALMALGHNERTVAGE